MRKKKMLLWTGGLLAVIVLGLAVTALVVIGPRNLWGMLRYDTRKEGDLKVGQEAPDVALTALDGTRVHLRERMTGEKPLILIFGSYT
jgi:hypothetical protein